MWLSGTLMTCWHLLLTKTAAQAQSHGPCSHCLLAPENNFLRATLAPLPLSLLETSLLSWGFPSFPTAVMQENTLLCSGAGLFSPMTQPFIARKAEPTWQGCVDMCPLCLGPPACSQSFQWSPECDSGGWIHPVTFTEGTEETLRAEPLGWGPKALRGDQVLAPQAWCC